MPQRTCSESDCDRKHLARGMCRLHWKRRYGKPTRYPITCHTCGIECTSSRKDGRFCTDECKGEAYQTERRKYSRELVGPVERTFMLLPIRHPARQPVPIARVWYAGECAWCGTNYLANQPTTRHCSPRCSKKAGKVRRRAREHNTLNNWRWSDFMRLARAFDYCCAYCGIKPERLDPDHVVPLSRGGMDAVSNLLPACPSCNCHKRDLLLHEWAADRTTRRLPSVKTAWTMGDRRYTHLTDALLISPTA